jgi:hypothetical protein
MAYWMRFWAGVHWLKRQVIARNGHYACQPRPRARPPRHRRPCEAFDLPGAHGQGGGLNAQTGPPRHD